MIQEIVWIIIAIILEKNINLTSLK